MFLLKKIIAPFLMPEGTEVRGRRSGDGRQIKGWLDGLMNPFGMDG